jgi:multiple sugar transport system substrate-binding protein
MKRRYTMLCIGATGVMLLAGCGVGPSAPGSGSNNNSSTSASGGNSSTDLNWNGTSDPSLKGQTITVLWTDIFGANGPRAALLKQFTKETGINVKEIGVDYNSVYNKVMTAAMANSSDIDVAEMDTIWAGQYLKGNVAEDLTNVIPKDVQSSFTNSSLSSVEYQGHLMAMPWFSSTKHFYWNINMLHKAGIQSPPKTWDEFLTDSKLIQQKLGNQGIYASGWSWKQAESLTCDYVGMVGAFGGSFFGSDGKPDFNSGGGLQAMQYMTNLMKSGTVDPASLQWTEQDVQNAFEAGKIAMMSNWEAMYPQLNDPTKSKVVNQTDVGLLPGEGSVVSSSVTGSEGVAILKGSKHKEAALAFLKWVGSKEYQLAEFKQDGQYPTLQSLYTDPDTIKADSTQTLSKIAAEFQYGVNRPNAPGYVDWSDKLSADLHGALLGQKSPDAALNDAVTQINNAMAND